MEWFFLRPVLIIFHADTCNGACPLYLDLVCESDGITYDNECLSNFAPSINIHYHMCRQNKKS